MSTESATVTNEESHATANPGNGENANQSVLDSLPNWLKPGVAQETHLYDFSVYIFSHGKTSVETHHN